MKPTTNDTHRYNEFGQPVGADLPRWTPPPFPPHVPLAGRYARLEPLDVARHARDVFDAQSDDPGGERWTYSFSGPFADLAAYERWMTGHRPRAIRNTTPSSMPHRAAPREPPPTCASSRAMA
jgi:hypothetical protein